MCTLRVYTIAMKYSMKNVGIKEARQNLPGLIDQVAAGDEIIITRQGRAVARLVPVTVAHHKLPPLGELRNKMGATGSPSSQLLRDERDQA